MTEGFDVPVIAWGPLIDRNEYNNAFFYHGSQGALATIRWRNWKLYLNPSLQLYDLAENPSESKRVLKQKITCKLRGMAILFQEEMRLDPRERLHRHLAATAAPRYQPSRAKVRVEVARQFPEPEKAANRPALNVKGYPDQIEFSLKN